jgi:uncharacterized Tic20 family protein
MLSPKPTTEERIWAVISHLSALAFGMGIALPVVGWSDQRQKSKYASFQCLQALGYQSLGYTIWLLTYIILVIFLLLLFILAQGSIQRNQSLLFAWVVIFVVGMIGLLGLYLVLPVIAAIACAFGRDFYYPIMGRRLAQFLESKSSEGNDDSRFWNEEHADRWVAAMGHFSVIIIFWGVLAPGTAWVLQGGRNSFLKFQSVQATLYQIAVNLFYLGAVFLSIFGTIPMALLSGLQTGTSAGSSTTMIGLVIFLVTMLVAFLFLLIVPLFHILGQWAGYRVLKGDKYRYPILGKLIEKRLAKSYGVQEQAPGSNSVPYEHDQMSDATKETS